MSAPKRATEDLTKRSDEQTQDEIEQIMSEIEQLQKEIGQADAGAMPAPAARPKPQLVKPEPSADGPSFESSVTDTDPLEEFRAAAGAAGDISMEDTIGELKAEEGSATGALYGDPAPPDEEPGTEPEPRLEEDEELPETARETRDAIARASREVEEAFEEKSGCGETTEDKSMSIRDHEDAGSGGDGALNMTLRGNMTLKLQYEVDGQTVTIGFADHALKVQLADGTEFKIPMRARTPVRRTA